jgi:hypothetical protein
MTFISKKLGLRLAALTAATVGLSGCVYDAGLGYASDGYGYNDYNCDPYSAFDSYYDCDNSYGFYNIGFGGGWYDSFWYPGHGYYVFDNYGRRFNMRDNHRRYWGDRRQRWYRDNRGHDGGRSYGQGRNHDDNRGDGRGHDRGRGGGHNATNGGADQPIAWPERNGGRREERPGRRAEPTPPSDATVDRGWGRRGDNGRGDGRRGRDNAQAGDAVAQPTARPMARPGPDGRYERGGERGGRGDGGGRNRVQQPTNAAPQNAAPPPPPAVRVDRPAREPDARQTARPRGDGPRGRPRRVEE